MKYLKISTLNKGWQETDEMMLHAVMQLLVDYVEKQKPDQVIDWSSDKDHVDAWTTIMLVYTWWKYTRPERVDPLDEIEVPDDYMTIGEPDENGNCPAIWGDYPEIHAAMAVANKIEQDWYEEDTEMMLRIVKIRHMLWT